MSDLPDKLGKYLIRRAIGQGAMGVVYEGFDPVIERPVAIKTIRRGPFDAAGADELARRLRAEARAAGRLGHRHIVGIHDCGEARGRPFVVMELVRGRELKSFLAARHRFPPRQVVRLMRELLDALGHAHGRDVVHRDVKPANLFVTDEGSIKLGDFGIARVGPTPATPAHALLGTPNYMAPELIRGEDADARADLYAAGVILHELLVGERPFAGGVVAVMQQVLAQAPRAPSARDASIPTALDAVVLRALAPRPGDRFASAAEFRRALVAAAEAAGSAWLASPVGMTAPGVGRGAIAARKSPPGPGPRLESLERRLASHDGAWGAESRALEALDPAAGETAVAPIQARLDRLAASVRQADEGRTTLRARWPELSPAYRERLAVIDAQLAAQGRFVERLRDEVEAARRRARGQAPRTAP